MVHTYTTLLEILSVIPWFLWCALCAQQDNKVCRKADLAMRQQSV